MSAPTIEKLRLMSDEELIKKHDELTIHTLLGVSYYVEELARRSNSRQAETMLRYTKWITLMTIVMSLATLLNLWIAFKLLN